MTFRADPVRRWVLSLLLLAGSALHSPSPAQSVVPAQNRWTLDWSADGGVKPEFRGLNNLDGAGQSQSAMLYPSPSPLGLLVGILTHAALSEGSQRNEALARQERANQVLGPYAASLSTVDKQDLLERTPNALQALGSVHAGAIASPAESPPWALAVLPIYTMTQDSKALIADVTLSLKSTAAPGAARKIMIRVVSQPQNKSNLVAAWNAEDGALLKQEAVQLLALAIHHGMSELINTDTRPMAKERTVRFPQGGEVQMERAQVLDQRCGRSLLRNLRGELMSVPDETDQSSARECSLGAPVK
jgi:hypothetical protein